MFKKTRQLILLAGDIIFLYLALFLTCYFGFWGNYSPAILQQHILPFSLLYAIWLIIFYIFGLYELDFNRPSITLWARIGGCLFFSALIGISFFYLTPIFNITPKTNLAINIAFVGLFLVIWRRAFYYLFSSFYLQRLAFLGENPLARELAKEIEKQPQLGYKVIKFLDPKKNIVSQIKRDRIDVLIISQEIKASPALIRQLYKSLSLRISCKDLSQTYELIFNKIPIRFIPQSWFLENLSEGEKKSYDKVKRFIDIILSLIIITITIPLWLIFALLIKLEDKGPVLYKQERVGKDGKTFWLFKFRSMQVNAEKKKAQWAKQNDPRITKTGKFLRASHLDELPQMINILKGDISLVGPRPERPVFVKKLEKDIPHYHIRHIIKPGFTGWAQIRFRYGRSVEDSQEKLQYDLYYIKNRSFFLDLEILLKTFQLFFKRE
jgi:exopolysaccharide biosynthesis polyprenyl glycosylphosphotransferase